MFDNVAFNVVLGLTLVYLLYSMLVTILSEMVSTWLGIRPRLLRLAIERMLNDGYYHKIKGEKRPQFSFNALEHMALFFLQESKQFKGSFAGRFYDYPSIKYLAQIGSDQRTLLGQSKPAYMNPATFADTLTNMLSDKGMGKDKLERVQYCLKYNTQHIEPETRRQIQNMLDNSGGTIDGFSDGLKQWFTETMDRANGWYKGRLRLILLLVGFVLAVAFHVDSIQIAHTLTKDKEARQQLVDLGVTLAKDTARYAHSVQGADGQNVYPESVLDSGLSHVTKDIESSNTILGLGWNFDTLLKSDREELKDLEQGQMYDLLMTQKKLYDLAITLKYERGAKLLMDEQTVDSLRKRLEIKIIDSLMHADSMIMKGVSPAAVRDSAISADTAITHARARLRNALGVRSEDSLLLRLAEDQLKRSLQAINQQAGTRYVRLDTLYVDPASRWLVLDGQIKRGIGAKIWYVVSNSLGSKLIIGFLLTALALSLGAPFWFDLLKKLVSIRGAGVKPEDTDQASQTAQKPQVPAVQPPATLAAAAPPAAPPADPLDAAVAILKSQYGSMSGVVSIEQGFIRISGRKVPAIEVHALDPNTLANLNSKIGPANAGFPVNYIKNTRARAQLKCGDQIENGILKNILGTLGCLVNKQNDARLYLMSCWHVLQQLNTPVIDGNNNTIATVSDGSITDIFDIGFALMSSPPVFTNAALGITQPYRALTPSDAIDETGVIFTGANKGLVNGAVIYKFVVDPKTLYNDANNSNYVLNDLFSITLFDENGAAIAPSNDGDSGSLIIDLKGCPIGVLVGGDSNYTYGIKLSNLFAQNSIYHAYSLSK